MEIELKCYLTIDKDNDWASYVSKECHNIWNKKLAQGHNNLIFCTFGSGMEI